MINQDMIDAAKELLLQLADLRPQLEGVNNTILAIMDNPDPAPAMISFLPSIIETSSLTGSLIMETLAKVNWEKEGNTYDLLVDLLSGRGEVPEELLPALAAHKEAMELSEKMLVDRYGDNPLLECLKRCGLEETFVMSMNSSGKSQELADVMDKITDVSPRS